MQPSTVPQHEDPNHTPPETFQLAILLGFNKLKHTSFLDKIRSITMFGFIIMKPVMKCFLIGASVVGLMLVSFIAGAYCRPTFSIDPPALRGISTMIHVDPIPDGPLYSTEDYFRAKIAVDNFLSREKENPKYEHLDLGYFVTPDVMGYTTYTYSALKNKGAGRPFPDKLKAQADKVFKDALNSNQTEQDGGGNGE